MATYASTTNPFIRPNETNSTDTNELGPTVGESVGRHSSTRKSTPGMARPRKSSDDLNPDKTKANGRHENLLLDETIVPNCSKQADVDGLLNLIETDQTLSVSDQNNNNNKLEQLGKGIAGLGVEQSTDLECSDLQKPQTNSTGLVDEDIELEIGETCLRLVEQAAKLSLSSAAPQLQDEPNRESLKTTKSRSDEGNLTPSLVLDLAGSDEKLLSTSNLIAPKSAQASKQSLAKGNDNDDNEDEEDELLIQSDGSETNDMVGLDNDKRARTMELNSRQHQHIELIKKLRLQLRDLEKYAYERGELDQVPPSILAERQTVILDKLRKRLSLNLDKDKIEKLELEELKKQVDEEISNLIDPLITKEHLLNQLKTQLTDLERYISHLHGAVGKGNAIDKNGDCSCSLHGCSSSVSSSSASSSASSTYSPANIDPNRSIITNETLPKTSRLIRGLMAQLICSDIKIQEAMRLESELVKEKRSCELQSSNSQNSGKNKNGSKACTTNITTKAPQFHDGAAWTLHIDRIILATDSLTNLFNLTPKRQQRQGKNNTELRHHQATTETNQNQVDESLVESVVRRQLVPALRDLLAYGLIDPSTLPSRSSYVSFLFDPYYLLTSFSCLPGSQVKSETSETRQAAAPMEKVHVWNIIEDYFESKNEVNFRTSSVKTLSQSFSLTPSMDGPIKITSKQALLIAIDDIMSQLAKRKPNGPESHFKLFVYVALNQGKLATWIRIIFRNKSILKKYYHEFSFVSQQEKMDKFLATIEELSQFKFSIDTDAEATDQFVSAF